MSKAVFYFTSLVNDAKIDINPFSLIILPVLFSTPCPTEFFFHWSRRFIVTNGKKIPLGAAKILLGAVSSDNIKEIPGTAD
jgi:hypothetical protein